MRRRTASTWQDLDRVMGDITSYHFERVEIEREATYTNKINPPVCRSPVSETSTFSADAGPAFFVHLSHVTNLPWHTSAPTITDDAVVLEASNPKPKSLVYFVRFFPKLSHELLMPGSRENTLRKVLAQRFGRLLAR